VAADIAEIRSHYIQNNLHRALNGDDRLLAWVMAAEFRRYFSWVADTLPQTDRQVIVEQLSKLEQICASNRQPIDPRSMHADRVGHQLEEAAFA
jgi:hypothetical protein